MHYANATADLSTSNGTCTILDQHKACPDHDDDEHPWLNPLKNIMHGGLYDSASALVAVVAVLPVS